MAKCMYYLKGDACKCGCTDAVVRMECTSCGAEPLVCDCGNGWFRVIRLSDGVVVNDM